MGSIPIRAAVIRAEVQMEARLFWEQEGSGSTPGCPTLMVGEGWLPRLG